MRQRSPSKYASQRITICGQCYETHVDGLSSNNQGAVIRTLDRRFFKLSPHAASLLAQIEACDGLSPEQPEHARLLKFFNEYLLRRGIYQPVGVRSFAPAGKARTRTGVYRRLISSEHVCRLAAVLTWAVRPAIFVLLLVMSAAAMLIFAARTWPHVSYASLTTYEPWALALLIVLTLASAMVHEMGHATCCYALAGSAGEIGVGLYTVFPVAYADVSDIFLLPRSRKWVVALGGIAFQLMFVSLFIPWSHNALIRNFILTSQAQMAMMLVPFYKSDGHWLISDLSNSPDLTRDSLRMIAAGRLAAWNIVYAVVSLGLLCAGIAWSVYFTLRLGPSEWRKLEMAPLQASGYVHGGILVVQYVVIATGVFALLFAAAKAYRAFNLPHAEELSPPYAGWRV